MSGYAEVLIWNLQLHASRESLWIFPYPKLDFLDFKEFTNIINKILTKLLILHKIGVILRLALN